MKQLLKIIKFETRNILFSKNIWLYSLFYLVNYLISAFFFKLYGSEFTVLTTGNGQSFPIQHLQASYLVTGIFIGIYVSEITIVARNHGTIKLILLSTVSRGLYFISRIIMVFIFTMILTILMLILSYLVGTLSFGWGDFLLFHDIQASGLQRVGLTLISGFVYGLAYFAFGCLVLLLGQFTNKLLECVALAGVLLMIGQYAELFPTFKQYTIFHQMLFFCHDILDQTVGDNLINLWIVTGYALFFASVGYFIFKKKDLYV